MLDKNSSPEEIEKDRERVKKEIAKISKLLSAERHTHPNNVTDREINLLNDLFSIKSAEIFRRLWHADNITKIMRPTIERIPSKEQIETLMRGKEIPACYEYWVKLYHNLGGNKGKEVGKNIIHAAATATEEFTFGYHNEGGLVGFYTSLIEKPDDYAPKNDFAKNPELATLMLSEIDKRLKMESQNYNASAAKKFLMSTSDIVMSYPKGIAQCKELMTTIHGIEKKQLETQQNKESEYLDKIFSYQPPVKSWQKE